MLSIQYIAYAVIAVGIFTFYMAAINLLRSKHGNKRPINVEEVSYSSDVEDMGEPETSAFAEFANGVLSKFNSGSIVRPALHKEVSRKLMLAGLYSPNAISYYLFFKKIIQPILLMIGLYIAYVGFKHAAGISDVLKYLIACGLFILFGLNGADIYVANARQKRITRLNESFPEVMDLLLVCIEAGLGLDAALNRVCKELRSMHPEVIAEFDRTRLELSMLGDRVTALQNLLERTGTLSFSTLVSALVQTEKFGTSLVDTLRVLSEEQRITRLYTAEQKAARIPVFITIPLILFIMPAFVMIILGPPVVKYLESEKVTVAK
jgi:tight adherence protein C